MSLKNFIFNLYKSNKKIIRCLNERKAQVGAEMLLLIGGMIVIVLIAIYFYKDYLLGIGNEINSTEIGELNHSIKNISLKFN